MNKFLIIFKNSNRLNTSLTDQYHSFELMDFYPCIVRRVRILLIYRPPGLSTSLFLEEFSKLLEHITADLRHKRLLIDDIRIPRRPWDESLHSMIARLELFGKHTNISPGWIAAKRYESAKKLQDLKAETLRVS